MPISPVKRRTFVPILVAGASLLAGAGFLSSRLAPGNSAPIAAIPQPEARERELREAVRRTPTDPRPAVELGVYLLDAGRNHDALDVAVEARGRFPDSTPVAALLGDAREATGRLLEALAAYRPLSRLPVSRYRQRYAELLARNGLRSEAVTFLAQQRPRDSGEALSLAKAALEALSPGTAVRLLQPWAAKPDAYHAVVAGHGLALLNDRQYSAAAATFDRARPLGREDAALLYYLGSALRLSADLSRLPEASERLTRAAELQPADGLILYELALVRVQMRDWEGARRVMERAVELAPEVPEVRRDLARLYDRAKEPLKAALTRAEYHRILAGPEAASRELAPFARHDRSARFELAGARLGARKPAETLRMLEALHREDPSDLAVLWELSRVEDQLHHYQKSLEWLEKAQTLDTGIHTLELKSALLNTMGRYPDAEALLVRLRDREAASADRHFRLGRFRALWADRTAAEHDLREAVRLDPGHSEAHHALGDLLLARDRPAEAVAHLRRALDLDPYSHLALQSLGRAYTRLRRPEAAREYIALANRAAAQRDERARLERRIRQQREPTRARKELAALLQRAGDLPGAVRELEIAAAAAPTDRATLRELEPLYGRVRRFTRQYEIARALGSGS